MRTNYNYDNGIATFNIYYKDKTFKGKAYCCPEDKDMESARTGLFIAESRANIQLSKYLVTNEYEPELHAIKDLLSFLGPDFQETSQIEKYMAVLSEKIKTINENIENTESYLNEYIQTKDKLYKRLRKVKNK